MDDRKGTRRQWLGDSGRMVGGALLGGGIVGGGILGRVAPALAKQPPAKKSRVVLIRDKAVFDRRGKLQPQVLGRMLDQGVAKLLGERGGGGAGSQKGVASQKDVDRAWSRLIRPKDVVGIKTNVWQHLPTPPELNAALERRVIGCGVAADRVSVDDRGVLRDPVFRRATALINVRPMRTHHWAGVGSLVKNYIMFAPKPWAYHDDACADLAAIWKLPIARGKTRLNVLVMLTPLFYGVGPHHYDPKYVWRYGGLLVGTDPVAVDATGLRIIEAKRKAHFRESRRWRPSPKHIRLAGSRHKLGTADPARIELVKLGWAEGRLI